MISLPQLFVKPIVSQLEISFVLLDIDQFAGIINIDHNTTVKLVLRVFSISFSFIFPIYLECFNAPCPYAFSSHFFVVFLKTLLCFTFLWDFLQNIKSVNDQSLYECDSLVFKKKKTSICDRFNLACVNIYQIDTLSAVIFKFVYFHYVSLIVI